MSAFGCIADIVVHAGWNADFSMGWAEYLCTDAAKNPDMIEWAHDRVVTSERVKCSEGKCTKKALVRENYFSIL